MSFHSPFPDVEIPATSIYEFLFGSLTDAELELPAFIDGPSGAVTTYGELIAHINGVAGALAARGIEPGDVVALHSPNVPAFGSVFHGILRAGATATTINALYTADDIAKQLEDSNAKFLFTVSPLLPQAKAGAEQAGLAADRIVVLDGSEGYASLRDLLTELAPTPRVSIDPEEHLAVLPYSSGTTGRPKGVMLTHRNLVANVCQASDGLGGGQHRILSVLPFFHIYGMTVLLNIALRNRSTLVTMPRFDLMEFLRITSEHKCTQVFIAPPIAVALAKHPAVDQFDLSSVELVFSGAAPLDANLGQAVAQRLNCQVRQGYGMSEMSPVSHLIPVNRDDVALDSVGFTVPNMECKLVDPGTGEEIQVPESGVSEPGELWCKGPNIMRGYLGNAEATAETLVEDGYLRTGDIATVSSDGVVSIVDRLKELIKYKGYQVPPAELEALLLTHPQIADAAVIGVTDSEGEEVPKAFVVRQAESGLTEQEVIDFVAEKVSPHKKVRAVEFLEAVPKSAAGKILRKDLRAREAASA
ncbi:AMP-binding protein [Hoyosella subflava]|uniref:Long-chain-fatty-acid--CoA ligase n=1 Tax=Hoyosella subflava (strain DSM 45089 / JCM 17490 / NBRC 109087 / DQS3-9A1) TaxID=443218 RepID=F6EJN1_HOYSD|nr:AMP-binding protein [Hoyosella subflava]AEF39080.1 Long-chain-fatty-acid--CoA ligase [Hoyosella subflava DQS3-9A1]